MPDFFYIHLKLFFFSLLFTTPSFLLFLFLKKILGPPFHLEALDNYLIRLVEGLALVTAYLTIPNLWFGGTTRSVQQITWLTDLSADYRDVEIWMVDFCHTQLLVKRAPNHKKLLLPPRGPHHQLLPPNRKVPLSLNLWLAPHHQLTIKLTLVKKPNHG